MKIKKVIIVLAAGLCVTLGAKLGAGAAESAAPVLPGDPLEGSRLFAEKGCLRCHSISGVGGTGGPDLGQSVLKRSLLDIAGVMWNHSPGMAHLLEERHTTRPLFKPPEMASLLSFLYYLGSLEDRPGDPSIGSRLFREKSCQLCHSIHGLGGRHGPALDKYSWYASPIYVTVGLWNHGKVMADVMQAVGLSRPTFEKNDISDLLAYIRSTSTRLERIYAKPGNPRRGEKLFTEKQCSTCHSVGAQSDATRINLRVRLKKLKGSLMTIAGTMWNHGPKMWAEMYRRGITMSTFDAQEMSDLISYLYFLQFIDPPGVAARGRTVFKEKGCGRCHSASAADGVTAVDLSKVEKLETPLEVVTQMWNHATTMEQIMLQQSVEWPVFRGGEMADLMAYLISLRQGK